MTKKQNSIPNSRRRPQVPQIMAAAVEMHLAGHLGRTLRSASSEYNCMGMVFASRRTCIDVDQLEWILEEDGYKPVAPDAVCRGDLLVYRSAEGPAHVGVVWRHEPDVRRAVWRTEILESVGSRRRVFPRGRGRRAPVGHSASVLDRSPAIDHMNAKELCERLEATDTAAQLNVVSGWRQFVRALTQLQEFKALATEGR